MAVYLASASSARAKLLKGAGVKFTVEPADIDEGSVKARHASDDTRLSLTAVHAEIKGLEYFGREGVLAP